MTIRDIAKLAGVSPATVSKVLNNKADDVGEDTRARINAIVAEHNYVPYQGVAQRVSQSSTTVALLADDVSDIFVSKVIRGVEDVLRPYGISLVVCSTKYDRETERECIQRLKKMYVKGILRFPAEQSPDAIIDDYDHDDIFTVLLDDYQTFPHATKTVFNNRLGGRLATRHLIEAGHTRIGFITTHIKAPYLFERFTGYQQELAEHGIAYDESLVFCGDMENRRLCGYEGANYLLSQQAGAVFCSDDHVASGVYGAMMERGLSIPRDLSVMGFDNTMFSEMLYPPLSTIHQSGYDIGRNAAELMMAKLNGQPYEGKSVQVQPVLVARQSVCAPGGRAARRKAVAVAGEIHALMELQTRPGGEDGTGAREATALRTKPGGWAVERALALQKAGYEVLLLGCLGNDVPGRELYKGLQRLGLKTDGVLFHDGVATGLDVAHICGGQTSHTVYPGANALLHEAASQGWLPLLQKAGCGTVQGDKYPPLRQLLQTAQQQGVQAL